MIADEGVVHPIDGWTYLVITPERGVHIVDGYLWHEFGDMHLSVTAPVRTP